MTAFTLKYRHLRRTSVFFGLIWVLIILMFTYNESIIPKIWDECFSVRPKIIESLGKESYLLANIGIIALLVIEVLIGHFILNRKQNSDGIETSYFFMLSILGSTIMSVLLYLYCKNKSVSDFSLDKPLLWMFLLGWIGTLIYLKYEVFHNPVKVPVEKMENREKYQLIRIGEHATN